MILCLSRWATRSWTLGIDLSLCRQDLFFVNGKTAWSHSKRLTKPFGMQSKCIAHRPWRKDAVVGYSATMLLDLDCHCLLISDDIMVLRYEPWCSFIPEATPFLQLVFVIAAPISNDETTVRNQLIRVLLHKKAQPPESTDKGLQRTVENYATRSCWIQVQKARGGKSNKNIIRKRTLF